MINTTEMPIIVRHLRIHGQVQGVYYRQSLQEQAQALEVTGWVRNRLDSSVEAVVCGSPQALERLIEWSRTGPPAAVVSEVVVTETQGQYSGFERLPTV
jgi:acylphosphatase